MGVNIRIASEDDLSDIVKIYNHAVRDCGHLAR